MNMAPSCYYMCVPAAGEVVSDFLLVIPEQAMQGQHVGVVDERQAVVPRVWQVHIRGDLCEKPAQPRVKPIEWVVKLLFKANVSLLFYTTHVVFILSINKV